MGEQYQAREASSIWLIEVGPLPATIEAGWQPDRRPIVEAEDLLAEDPRLLAAVLVHELRHASHFDLVAVGLLAPDCVELEAQAIVTRAFWPDKLPDGSDWEKGLAMTGTTHENSGLDGLREWVGQTVGYQRECRGLSRAP